MPLYGIVLYIVAWTLVSTLRLVPENRLAYQIYPTLDLILAYFCLHLSLAWFSRGFSHVAKPWMVLVLAFAVFWVADYGYEVYVLFDAYRSYLWINPTWALGYPLVVVAANLQWNLMITLICDEEEIVLMNE